MTTKTILRSISLLMICLITTQSIKAQTSITMPDIYICSGNSTVLDAASGTCGASYLWNSAETTQQLPVSQAGTYQVLVTYADGSTCNKTFEVKYYNSSLNDIVSNATSYCSGSNITLNTSGGCNYVWSSNDYSISNPNGSSIGVTPQSAGTYVFNLTGTSYYGCQENKTISLTINPLPNITITASTETFVCAGTNITLTGNGATSYEWNNNETTQNINVTPQSNTTYVVTGTDANGCTNNASIAIETTTACVNIASNYCGITIHNLFDHKMFSTHNLPNVQQYIFTFTPINTTNSVSFTSNTYWMNLPLNGSLTYNTTYSVTVQALFTNGSYSPVSPACLFTLDYPETTIALNYCGITVNNLDGKMFSGFVGGASNYLFTFTPPVGSGLPTLSYNSNTYWMYLSYLTPDLSYNTSYSVTVQVTATGVTGPVSDVCILNVGSPQTNIAQTYCNITVNNLSGKMFAGSIGFSSNYLFTFTPPVGSGLPTSSFNSSTYWMWLSSAVPALTNNTTYSVTVQVTSAGVTGTVSPSCLFTIGNPSGRFINPNKISENEIVNNSDLIIFPNPAKEKINITLRNITDKKCTIEMYDLFGKLIYKNEEFNITGKEFNAEIDLTNLHLSKGLYLINVSSDSQKSSQRVAIEK